MLRSHWVMENMHVPSWECTSLIYIPSLWRQNLDRLEGNIVV